MIIIIAAAKWTFNGAGLQVLKSEQTTRWGGFIGWISLIGSIGQIIDLLNGQVFFSLLRLFKS